MSDSSTTEGMLADLMDRIIEEAKIYKEQLDNGLTGVPAGKTSLTDEQFRIWFTQMAAKDPDWVHALQYVENGPKELYRYERVMGIGPYMEGQNGNTG